MDSMNRWQSEREAYMVRVSREELAERIARAVSEDGTVEPLEGIRLRRASSTTEIGHSVSFPASCVVAQGSKEILLGEDRYRYDPAHYFITTAELPIASQITEASEERSYLRFLLKVDPPLVGSVMVEAGHAAEPFRREGHRREPGGLGSAGRRIKTSQAPGLPCRGELPRAAYQARDRF